MPASLGPRRHLTSKPNVCCFRVMRCSPGVLTRAESDALLARVEAQWQRHGFVCRVVRARDGERLLGLAGRMHGGSPRHSHLQWSSRIASPRVGGGRALLTEAARAALADGFDELMLPEVVAFTTRENSPSQRVMARAGSPAGAESRCCTSP
ncbi:MAG: hypothetical protein RL385_6118 [Pseudomonadota bacterium]